MLIDASVDFNLPFQCLVAGIAKEADSPPTFRVFGPSGAVGDGTAALAQTGNITAATNATPIVVTSNAHGLANGMVVTISGVGGNTNANGTFRVAGVTTNTFQLAGSAGNSAYTSGGQWRPTGLYALPVGGSLRSGLQPGQTYIAVVYFQAASVQYVASIPFTVVS